MAEFAGTYSATIDDKGRVVLPSAFKKEMGEMALEPLVIEKSLHKETLDIHPNKYWQERVKAFKVDLDPFDEDDDSMLQFFYQNFVKITMAANGRINLPADYLKYANLEKGVQFIGMGESIRLIAVTTSDKNTMTKAEFLHKLKERRKRKQDAK